MDLQALLDRLDGLDAALRKHGLRYGPDVWLKVNQLLHNLQRQNRLPAQPKQLAVLLGPLFCRYPEDQVRFPVIFHEWLDGDSRLSTQNQLNSSPLQALTQAKLKLSLTQKRWWLLAILLTFSLLTINYWIAGLQQPSNPAPINTETTSNPKPTRDIAPLPNADTQIAIQNVISPRPQPEPMENPWPILSQAVNWTIPGLPVLAALLWMVKQYHRRRVLRAEAAGSTDAINQLRFAPKFQPIFGGSDAERNLRDLRAASYEITRHLHIENTVERTARGGDYFQPMYQSKRQTNSHVILVRVQHPRDQQAAMAQELASRFRDLGLAVEVYSFRDDPRHLRRISNDKPTSLPQLLSRHRQDRLMIISETDILYHPLTGSLRPWLDHFKDWTPRLWLHTRNADGFDIQQLSEKGFMALPLRRDHFADLVDRLTGSKTKPADNPEPWPLPNSLSLEPDAWLREKPPLDADLDGLLWDLQQFLGSYGLLLFRAIAVYPKPHWHLSLALDFLLFGHLETADPAQRRETRLSRISRLPWLTQGHMPRWLREYLLTYIDDQERQQICTAWQKLFAQLTDTDRPEQLQLQLHAPGKRQLKWRLDELRALYPSELDDAIFSNILLGGKLGYLDFQLPQTLANILPQSRYWLSIKPAVLALFLALAGFSATDWLWQNYAQKPWEQALVTWQQQENRDWHVQLNATPDTQPLALALVNRLQAKNLQTSIDPIMAKPAQVESNVVSYPPQAFEQAQQIAKTLSWLTYGAETQLLADSNSLQGQNLMVTLSNNYQAGSSFNDTIPDTSQFERLKNRLQKISHIQQAFSNLIAWFDRAGLKPYEPETIVIPSGSFLMGSPDTEANRSEDEGPQHQVTIAKPFAIGKTEVTFAQYDAFADATGRKKPDDNGWGHGNRPVINVSFVDAQAYAKWLSGQTGKQYRLPTEAEWEYAARAGTTTPFHTGHCISTEQANYNGNIDYNRCGAKTGVNLSRTQEVGKYPANAWGLNDTAGNVWEWTTDCWHDNYQHAPQDGSQTWQEANQGDCGRRVIRGGSWY